MFSVWTVQKTSTKHIKLYKILSTTIDFHQLCSSRLESQEWAHSDYSWHSTLPRYSSPANAASLGTLMSLPFASWGCHYSWRARFTQRHSQSYASDALSSQHWICISGLPVDMSHGMLPSISKLATWSVRAIAPQDSESLHRNCCRQRCPIDTIILVGMIAWQPAAAAA